MGIKVEIHNIGDASTATEIRAIVEHVLSGYEGEWLLSIIGSRGSDNWDLTVQGPQGFERSFVLIGAAGHHEPGAIRQLLPKLLSRSGRL